MKNNEMTRQGVSQQKEEEWKTLTYFKIAMGFVLLGAAAYAWFQFGMNKPKPTSYKY
jgi:type VI protein secretion system component VasF